MDYGWTDGQPKNIILSAYYCRWRHDKTVYRAESTSNAKCIY